MPLEPVNSAHRHAQRFELGGETIDLRVVGRNNAEICCCERLGNAVLIDP